MKEWIRSKLIRLLGIDYLRELLDTEVNVINDKYNKLTDFIYETHKMHTDNEQILSDQIYNLNSLYSVGVDVDIRESRSWAVVCIEGKPEYVKFVKLNRQDVREVVGFLKRFEGGRQVIDSPFDMMKMFYDDGRINELKD